MEQAPNLFQFTDADVVRTSARMKEHLYVLECVRTWLQVIHGAIQEIVFLGFIMLNYKE